MKRRTFFVVAVFFFLFLLVAKALYADDLSCHVTFSSDATSSEIDEVNNTFTGSASFSYGYYDTNTNELCYNYNDYNDASLCSSSLIGYNGNHVTSVFNASTVCSAPSQPQVCCMSYSDGINNNQVSFSTVDNACPSGTIEICSAPCNDTSCTADDSSYGCCTNTTRYYWMPRDICVPSYGFISPYAIDLGLDGNSCKATQITWCSPLDCSAPVNTPCNYTGPAPNHPLIELESGTWYVCGGVNNYTTQAACQAACQTTPSSCQPGDQAPQNIQDQCAAMTPSSPDCSYVPVCAGGSWQCQQECPASDCSLPQPDCNLDSSCSYHAECQGSQWQCVPDATQPPSCPITPGTGNQPQCSDGVDNNNDGYVDLDDGGCSSQDDPIEANCNDGIKNQDEIGIDCGGSCAPCQECYVGSYTIQKGECVTKSETNIEGGMICLDVGGNAQVVPDCDQCTYCPNGGQCNPITGLCEPPREIDCGDGIDNDYNGLVDCQDPQCFGKLCNADGYGGSHNPYADPNNLCSWNRDAPSNNDTYYCSLSPARDCDDDDGDNNELTGTLETPGSCLNCQGSDLKAPVLGNVIQNQQQPLFQLSWSLPSCQQALQKYILYSCSVSLSDPFDPSYDYCNPFEDGNVVYQGVDTTYQFSYAGIHDTIFCFGVKANYGTEERKSGDIKCMPTADEECLGNSDKKFCTFDDLGNLRKKCVCSDYLQAKCSSQEPPDNTLFTQRNVEFLCPSYDPSTYCSLDENGIFHCLPKGDCMTCNAPYTLFGIAQDDASYVTYRTGSLQQLTASSCNTYPTCALAKNATSVESFVDCNEINSMGCYGYTTQEACEGYSSANWDYNNKCLSRNCSWVSLNPELGTGVCIEQEKEYQLCVLCGLYNQDDVDRAVSKGYLTADQESLARRFVALSNPLFDLCTVETCEQFGDCYALDKTQDGIIKYYTDGEIIADEFCINQDQVDCSDYTYERNPSLTQDYCLGTSGSKGPYAAGNNFDLDIVYSSTTAIDGTNIPHQISFDNVSIGKCKLSYDKGYPSCFTDRDDDGVPDAPTNGNYDYYPPFMSIESLKVGDLTSIPYVAYDVDKDGNVCLSSSQENTCAGVKEAYACAVYIDPADSSCYDYASAKQCLAEGKNYCRTGNTGKCINPGESCSGHLYEYTDDFLNLTPSSCYCYPTQTPNSDGFFDLQASASGDYFVYYYAVDKANNPGPVKTARITVDGRGPDIIVDTQAARNDTGYIVLEGSFTEVDPPRSNVTFFFNTTEPALCTAVLEGATASYQVNVYPKTLERRFVAENNAMNGGLPDGIYSMKITCEDTLGNVNTESFPILINADKRILGYFPNARLPLNLTAFNLSIHTGYPMDCSYTIKLLDGTTVFSGQNLVDISLPSGEHYYTTFLNFTQRMLSLGKSPYAPYILDISCSLQGQYSVPATKHDVFVLDNYKPVTYFVDQFGASYNFSQWYATYNQLHAYCEPFIDGGFSCEAIHYCLSPFRCDPYETNANDVPAATYNVLTHVQERLIQALPQVAAPRYLCVSSQKEEKSPDDIFTGVYAPYKPHYSLPSRLGGQQETSYCQKLLVDRVKPKIIAPPNTEGTSENPFVFTTNRFTKTFVFDDYVYTNYDGGIWKFFNNNLYADDAVHLDNDKANGAYALRNFTAEFSFTLDRTKNLPYFHLLFRAKNATEYYALVFDGFSTTSYNNKLSLVKYSHSSYAPSTYSYSLADTTGFIYPFANDDHLYINGTLTANGTDFVVTISAKNGNNEFIPVASLSGIDKTSTPYLEGVFGYRLPDNAEQKPQNMKFAVRDLDLDNYFHVLLYESSNIISDEVTNGSIILSPAFDLGENIVRTFTLHVEDKSYPPNWIERDIYAVNDQEPPELDRMGITNYYYYQAGARNYYQGAVRQVSNNLIVLERPSNLTLVVYASDTYSKNLSRVIANISDRGIWHGYDLSYAGIYSGNTFVYHGNLTLENFALGDHTLNLTLVDRGGNVKSYLYTVSIEDNIMPQVNMTIYSDEQKTQAPLELHYKHYYVDIIAEEPITIPDNGLNLTVNGAGNRPDIVISLAGNNQPSTHFTGEFIPSSQYKGYEGPLYVRFHGVDTAGNDITVITINQTGTDWIPFSAQGPQEPYFYPGFMAQSLLYDTLYPDKLYPLKNEQGYYTGTFVTHEPSLYLTGFAPEADNFTLYVNEKPKTLAITTNALLGSTPEQIVDVYNEDSDGDGTDDIGVFVVQGDITGNSQFIDHYALPSSGQNQYPIAAYGHFGELYKVTDLSLSSRGGDSVTLVKVTPPVDGLLAPFSSYKQLYFFEDENMSELFGASTSALQSGNNDVYGVAMSDVNDFAVETNTHYTIFYDNVEPQLLTTFPLKDWTISTKFPEFRVSFSDNKPTAPLEEVNFTITVGGTVYHVPAHFRELHDYPGSKEYEAWIAVREIPNFLDANQNAPEGDYEVQIIARDQLGGTLTASWTFTAVNGEQAMPLIALRNPNRFLNTNHDLFHYTLANGKTFDEAAFADVNFTHDDFIYFSNTTDLSALSLRLLLADPSLTIDEFNATLFNDTFSVSSVVEGSQEMMLDLSSFPLVEGEYTLRIWFNYSDSPNQFVYLMKIVIDTTKPTIHDFVVSPTNILPNSDSLGFSFTLDESYQSSLFARLENESVEPSSYVFSTEDKDYFLVQSGYNTFSSLAVGNLQNNAYYQLQMTLYDQAGNMAENNSFVFIDGTAPQFSYEALPVIANQNIHILDNLHIITNTNALLLNITMNPSTSSDINRSFVCYINNQLPSLYCARTRVWFENETITLPLQLRGARGNTIINTITLMAEDLAGNQQNLTFNVTVDQEPPAYVPDSVEGNLTPGHPLKIELTEPAWILENDLVARNLKTRQQYQLYVVHNESNRYYTFGVQSPMVNGSYSFSFTAEDFMGNRITLTPDYFFTYAIAPFDFNLTKPSFGWTSEEIFSIEIQATRPTEACGFDNNSNFLMADIEDLAFGMHTTDGMTFVSDDPVNISDFGNYLLVKCRDIYSGEVTKEYTLVFDNEPLSLSSAYFDPNPITQWRRLEDNSFTLFTDLKITTSKPSLCRFDVQDKDFDAMAFAVEGHDASHTQRVIDGDQFTYRNGMESIVYYLKCKTLADIVMDESEILNLTFNFSQGLSITAKSSPLYTSQLSSLMLNVTTNKYAFCYFNDENTLEGAQRFTSDSLTEQLVHTHKFPFNTLPHEGHYQYYVICENAANHNDVAVTTLDIYYDKTPPVFYNISLPPTLCDLYSIPVEFNAEENVSEILGYNYSLFKGNLRLISWQFTDDDDFVIKGNDFDEDLNLTEGGRYYIKAAVRNNAVPQWSPFKQSNVVLVDSSSEECQVCGDGYCFASFESCATCPQDCGVCSANCSNGIYDPDLETDVDCGGDCQQCDIGMYCEKNIDCLSGWCAPLANGTKVCQENPCENLRFDSLYETDVDCGKQCGGCDIGQKCEDDSDCAGDLFCPAETKRCTTPSCSDNYLNQDETDVDCGGSCVFEGNLCELGQQCSLNDDCASGWCNNGVCAEPSCTDNVLNQDETDIDCGGSCVALGYRCPIGASCKTNNDCDSGLCNASICVEDKNKDSDADGLPDWWELAHNLDPFDPSDGLSDDDNDGLNNYQEYVKDLNPWEADTDGDGFTDGEEIAAFTNPKDPTDFPKRSNVLGMILFIILLVLVLGGGGYVGYLYYLKQNKKQPPQFIKKLNNTGRTLGQQMIKGVQQLRRTLGLQQPSQRPKVSPLKLKREQEKEKQKKQLLAAFEEKEPQQKPEQQPSIQVKKEEKLATKQLGKTLPQKKAEHDDEGKWLEITPEGTLKKPKEPSYVQLNADDPFAKLKKLTEEKGTSLEEKVSPKKKEDSQKVFKKLKRLTEMKSSSSQQRKQKQDDHSSSEQKSQEQTEDTFKKLKTLTKGSLQKKKETQNDSKKK